MRPEGFLLVALLAMNLGACGDGDNGSHVNEEPLPLPRAETARDCLRAAGFSVLGGPRPAGDRNAPDVELIARQGRAVAFIGFYRTAERAARYEGSLRRNAARFNGTVERRGRTSIVWGPHVSANTRRVIELCVFEAQGELLTPPAPKGVGTGG